MYVLHNVATLTTAGIDKMAAIEMGCLGALWSDLC